MHFKVPFIQAQPRENHSVQSFHYAKALIACNESQQHLKVKKELHFNSKIIFTV